MKQGLAVGNGEKPQHKQRITYSSAKIERDAKAFKEHFARCLLGLARTGDRIPSPRFHVLNIDPDRDLLTSEEALCRTASILANAPGITEADVLTFAFDVAAFFWERQPQISHCVRALDVAEAQAQYEFDTAQICAAHTSGGLTVEQRDSLLRALDRHMVALRALREKHGRDQVHAKVRANRGSRVLA